MISSRRRMGFSLSGRSWFSRPGPRLSWRQGGQVRREHQHIVDGKLFNGWLHERAAYSRSGAVLEVVELADGIVRRAAGNPRYGPEPFQVGAVAGAARDGLAPAPASSQRPAFLNAAHRHESDENGVC